MRSHVLFISGRSGVGKSTAAVALHELLIARNIEHAVIEGDYLDLAHPAPHIAFPESDLAERNLAAMWSAYSSLGYVRLVYTNTVAALSLPGLIAAIGGDPIVTSVLLRSSDGAARRRLGRRNHGPVSADELERTTGVGRRLDAHAAQAVHRIETDDRSPSDIAAALLGLTGWGTE